MLETIREYGLERLAEAGETERLRLAHAGHLLALATEAEPRLRRADQLDCAAAARARSTTTCTRRSAAAIDAGDAAHRVRADRPAGLVLVAARAPSRGRGLARDVLAMAGDADREDLALAYTFAALNGLEGARRIDEVKRLVPGGASGSPPGRLPASGAAADRPLAAIFDQPRRAGELRS